MNDWIQNLLGVSAPKSKTRKADVEDLIAALDALDGDPITSGFSVSRGDGMSYTTTTDIVFAGVPVARKVLGWGWGDSYLTEDGLALGDDMIQLMQAIIDKHQSMKALETADRIEKARKALEEAKNALATRRSEKEAANLPSEEKEQPDE